MFSEILLAVFPDNDIVQKLHKDARRRVAQ